MCVKKHCDDNAKERHVQWGKISMNEFNKQI